MAPSRRIAAAAAPLLLALAACSSLDQAAWNLRAVHTPSGDVARTAPVMGSWEFSWRRTFGSLAPPAYTAELGLEGKPPREISNPSRRALRYLNELADYSTRDRRAAGLQVEFATWLVADDPYVLVRERCCLILGRAAERLGVTEVLAPLPEGAAAPPEAVAAALRALFDAEEALRSDPGALAAAVEAARGLVLDRDGARRLLSACNALLLSSRRDREAFEPLLALQEELQRRCVSLGLGAALREPEDVALAAAFRAALPVDDSNLLDLLLGALERDRTFALVAGLEHVRAAGLPGGDSLTGAEREQWYETLVLLSLHPDGSVSVAACRALDAVAPAALGMLRPDAWALWKIERDDARRAAETEAAREDTGAEDGDDAGAGLVPGLEPEAPGGGGDGR